MINLLPEQSKIVNPQDYLMSTLATLLVLLVIGLLVATGYFRLEAARTKTAIAKQLEVRDQLEVTIKQDESLERDLAYIIDRKASFDKLESSVVDYGLLLDKIGASVPANLRLTNFALKEEGQTIEISGIAATRAEITSFIDTLNQSGLADQVTLSSANSQADGVHFGLTMSLAKKDEQQS